MIFPSWYTAILNYDSRGPTPSSEESIQAILNAIETVIGSAIAQGQSLNEVRAAILSDDQLLSPELRTSLSQVIDAAWAAHSGDSARVPSAVRLGPGEISLPCSA